MYVATIGFFDGVHCGHRFLISQVMAQAAVEGLGSMVVTMDCHPRTVVDTDYVPQLLTTNEERLALLRETGIEHVEVMRFDRAMSMMSARDFMHTILKERLHVCTLLMGYDHSFGHGGGTREQYEQWGAECGIKVIVAQELADTYSSSSAIRKMLQEGNVAEAARLLGHPYLLTGRVEGGHRVGRTLGFPTANLHIEQEKIIPTTGVYAVQTNLGRGIMNIGRRPTLDNGKDLSIEVHILDYEGDLYGQALQLQFIARLRQERKFQSVDMLREQICRDVEQARSVLGGVG